MKKLLFVLTLMCFAPLASAQQVALGSAMFELGAPRAQVLNMAQARFALVPSKRRGQYTVYPRQAPGEQRLGQPLGSITFDDNRLVRISRTLGSIRGVANVAAIENLIAAFAHAPDSSGVPVVRTTAQLAHGANLTRVYFSYPDRAIQVAVYRPADTSEQATAQISEQYALSGYGPSVPMPSQPVR